MGIIRGRPSLAEYTLIDHQKRGVYIFDDFITYVSVNGGATDELAVAFSGTGASIAAGPVDGDHPGVISLVLGTTTTGRCCVVTDTASFLFGGGAWVFEALVRIEDLSTVGEEYDLRVGFIDTVTGDQVDGAYFEYDRNTSANWSIVTANNSTRTRSDSGVVVAADAWIKLRIEVNAAGTSIAFKIDGTETTNSPISTNIPTGAGRVFGAGITAVKSAGTTSRSIYADYLSIKNELTTPRT